MLTKCPKIQNLNFNFKFIYFIPHKKKNTFLGQIRFAWEVLVCWHFCGCNCIQMLRKLMNSKDCTGSTFSIIIVPPFMISFDYSSYFSFMELHPVTKIMVFCLYCLNIKIIFVIIKLIIRSALAWPQFFFFHSLSFPHLFDFAALGVLAWGWGLPPWRGWEAWC